MSGKGALGWLILAVALAVPAFMFWNWWKLLNNKPVELSRKPAEAGPVFNPTIMAGDLTNPLASTATAAGLQAGATAQAAVEASTAAASAGVPARPDASASEAGAYAAGTVPGPSAAGTQAAAGGDSAAAQPGPPPSEAGVASAGQDPPRAEEATLRYQPKIHRDPMLSPMDIKRLAQIELEKEDERRRLEEAERNRHKKKVVVKPKAPPIESTVTLYGITAAPGSITAMVEVDGYETQIVRAGDRLPNGVRIARITQTTVTFQHRSKKWSRSMSK